jgi:hypothetical protein
LGFEHSAQAYTHKFPPPPQSIIQSLCYRRTLTSDSRSRDDRVPPHALHAPLPLTCPFSSASTGAQRGGAAAYRRPYAPYAGLRGRHAPP